MAAAAPTGCFKCGRPGHWSRDCPSAPSSTNPSPNPSNPNPRSSFPSSSSKFPNGGAHSEKPAAALKKSPKTRPKLTPDLLLSDDGLGYVLQYFPLSFKCRGRGHEEEPLEVPQTKAASEANCVDKSRDETPNQVEVSANASVPSKIQLTEEQKARIEASRQKALERAAVRASSSQAL